MKKFPGATPGTSLASMRDAARTIGHLSGRHGSGGVQQSLQAVYSVETPGFHKRAVLAAMIVNLTHRDRHAAPVILTLADAGTSDGLADVAAPQIDIAEIAPILKAPLKTKPPKTTVLSVRLEDATRLLFASMDEEEEPVVPPRKPAPEPQADATTAAPQMTRSDAAQEAGNAPLSPEMLRETTVSKPRKARASAKKAGPV